MSPIADKDGLLREGDVVTKINGSFIDSLESLKEARKLLENCKERLDLVVKRDGQKSIKNPIITSPIIGLNETKNNIMKGALNGGTQPPRPPLPQGTKNHLFLYCFLSSLHVPHTHILGTTKDTTETVQGEGITEHNISNTEVIEDATAEAIDEATIKSETEKLYEEACSIVSSTGGIVCTYVFLALFVRVTGIFRFSCALHG